MEIERKKEIKEFEFESKIMGTDLNVSIVTEQSEIAKEIFSEIMKILVFYENKFSRFLSNSELNILNKKKNLIVSKEFIEVIIESGKRYRETNGYFNPLIQIKKLGYTEDFKNLGKKKNITKDLVEYNLNFDQIIINEQSREVTLKENQELDFGGILKGYLAEKLSKEIKTKYPFIKGLVINLGGDIYCLGKDENNQKFNFSIHNPINKGSHSDVNNVGDEKIYIELDDQALATSGIYKRNWKADRKNTHHIINKDNLENPKNDIVSVSTVSESGSKADTYTKIFMAIGYQKALEILDDNNIKFVIIKNDGEIIKNLN